MIPILPLYQCHKRVRAAKITHIEPVGRDDVFREQKERLRLDFVDRVPTQEPLFAAGDDGHVLVLGEIGKHVIVSSDWLFKHTPAVGGYFVQYLLADGHLNGHTSFSPDRAFEEGYTFVPTMMVPREKS